MTTLSNECLCAGIIVADHVCDPVPRLPAAGELITTDQLRLTIGGCASNVAVDLAKLNIHPSIVGNVGDDFFGRFVRETLQDSGVDISQLAILPDEQTSGTLVINVANEDRRFIHTIGANAVFDARDLTPELLSSYKVLYLGGYCLAEQPTAARIADVFRTAQQLGVITVLDVVIPQPGEYWPRVESVLPFTDVFLPNTDEARSISGLDDPQQQAERFYEAGAKTVVVTCGEDGAVLVSNSHRIHAGTFQSEFTDGTGSGDAFDAGFIYGLLRQYELPDCLCFGSALGASCVRQTGATTGVFTEAELLKFVEESKARFAIETLPG